MGVVPIKALYRALKDLATLVPAARKAETATIIAIATQEMREVTNGPAIIDLVGSTLHIQAMLITSQEEAALDYCWATFPPVLQNPLLVVDSGGGSTQVIQGEGPTPAFAQSLPIGAGNMTQQFLKHDPPTKKEIQSLQAHIAAQVRPQRGVCQGGRHSRWFGGELCTPWRQLEARASPPSSISLSSRHSREYDGYPVIRSDILL